MDKIKFMRSVAWPQKSGEYLFIHTKIRGKNFIRFSQEGDDRHRPTLTRLELALDLPLGIIKEDDNSGGGLADVNLENKKARFYGSCGSLGAYDARFLEATLKNEGFSCTYD